MTELTWIESAMGPTELWVEGRTARDYESQGFVMVDYKPPPKWLMGCYSGRVKIRKPGSEETHVWSPELAALHKFVGDAYGRAHTGLRHGIVWKRLGEAHSLLFNEFRYHEDLIFVERFSDGPLEIPQARITGAIRDIAVKYRGDAARRIRCWAAEVATWEYKGTAREA